MRSAWKIPILVFAALLGLIYGIIFTAQVLGLLGLYRAWLAAPVTLAVSALAGWLYLRLGGANFLTAILEQPGPETGLPGRGAGSLDRVFLFCGLLLALLLVVVPVAGFPYSPASESLHWDVGTYHYPKALELVSSGSAWDVSIAYGDYPFGGESLTAFAALLTRDGSLFGAAHLLTCLLFLFGFWFLLRRYSGLPIGLTLFLTSLVLVSGYFKGTAFNIWWIYRFLIESIGKNDLFLGAGLLVMLLHAPVGAKANRQRLNLPGLALAGMIVLSTKPNGAPVAAALWVWAGLKLWQTAGQAPFRLASFPWKPAVLSGLVMLPGVLWVIRNLAAEGALVSTSTDAAQLQAWSIAANLFNPLFFLNMPRTFGVVCLVALAGLLLARFARPVDWTPPAAYLVLLAGFIITPASGFNRLDAPPDVQWRFAVALLALAFILPVSWAAPWIRTGLDWLERRWAAGILAAVGVVVFSGGFVFANQDAFTLKAANAIVLQDGFREPVGVDGYFSAFDYIHRNVRNSVVWVENGMSYYAFGPGFTNSISRKASSDYLAVFQTVWLWGDPGYPDFVSDPAWQKNWNLIYEDSEGRVYKRVK